MADVPFDPDEVVPIENPPPAEPPAIKTKVDQMKEWLLEINTAELEHVIRHAVKSRADTLIYFVFTKEVFTMDDKHFVAFKDWLLFNNVIDLPSMLKEAVGRLEDEQAETIQHT
jgi:hypothetical protein